MTIPISTIANVSVVIGAQFPQRAGFGTLNIVTDEAGTLNAVKRTASYATIDEVAVDWATSTEAYKAASIYFSQQPKPTSLIISRRFEISQSALLRGGSVVDNATNLASFTAINDGAFIISIDGDQQTISGLDFTVGHSNLSDVAATIQTALQLIGTGGYTASTCTYNGTRFLITSGTTGATSTISFLTSPGAGTDISSLLQMQQGEGAKANGIDAETITDSLTAIEAQNDSWYGFAFTKEIRDGVQINGENAVEAAATWASARVKVFFNTSNDLDSYDSATTNDIGSVLQDSNYRRVITTFSSFPLQYPSMSVSGRAFTVNFDQPNSTITLKFKNLPGVTSEDVTSGQKSVLDSKNINAFYDVGGTNIYAESVMADGTFFDEVHGVDWLTNALETEVFGVLYVNPTKIPYTNPGTAYIEQAMVKVFDQAVANGLLAPGETIDGRFLPKGYEIVITPVEDQTASNNAARILAGITFTALGAGAIHSVQINGVFEG